MPRRKRASQSMANSTPPVTLNDSSSSIAVDASLSPNASAETLPGLGRTLNRIIRWISQPIGQLVFVLYNWFYDTPNKHLLEYYRRCCDLAVPGCSSQTCGCSLRTLSPEINPRKANSVIISGAILDRYLWCCINHSRRMRMIEALDPTVESLVKFLSTENKSNTRLSTDYLQLVLCLGGNIDVSLPDAKISTVVGLRRHIAQLSGVKYPEASDKPDDVQSFLNCVRETKKEKDMRFPLIRAVRLYSMLALPTSAALLSEIQSIQESLQENPWSLICLACAIKRALHVWKVASSHADIHSSRDLEMLVIQRFMAMAPLYLSQMLDGTDETLTQSARAFRDFMALTARKTLGGIVTLPNRSKPRIRLPETILHWGFNHMGWERLSPAHQEWFKDFKIYIVQQVKSPLHVLLGSKEALIDLAGHAAKSPFGSIMVDDREDIDEVRFTPQDGTEFALQYLTELDIPALRFLLPISRHSRDPAVIEAYDVAIQRTSEQMGMSVDDIRLLLGRVTAAQPVGLTGVLPHPLASQPSSATGSPQLNSIAFPQPDLDTVGPSFPVPDTSGSTALQFQIIEEEEVIAMPDPERDSG